MSIAYAAESATTTSSRLTAALERVWGLIQERHEDVPDVFFTLGAGSGQNPLGIKLGHFAAERWTVGETEGVHEIFIGGEGLRRGATDVLGTLLHEAAHAVAFARGVKDTSRQGRWHNARFAAIGRELGLELAQHPQIGWSLTTVPTETQDSYREVLVQLELELTAYRASETGVILIGGTSGGDKAVGGPKPPAAGSSRNGLACVCGCGRKIRLSRSTLDAGAITCGVCGEDFAPKGTV